MVITVLVCTHLTGEIRSVKDPGTTILASFPDTCFFSLPDSSTPSSPASVFLPRSRGVTHLKIWTQRSLPECPPFARPVLPLLPVRPANRVPRQPRCTPGPQRPPSPTRRPILGSRLFLLSPGSDIRYYPSFSTRVPFCPGAPWSTGSPCTSPAARLPAASPTLPLARPGTVSAGTAGLRTLRLLPRQRFPRHECES